MIREKTSDAGGSGERRVTGEATRSLASRQAAVLYPIVGKLQLYADEPLAVERAAGMYRYAGGGSV